MHILQQWIIWWRGNCKNTNTNTNTALVDVCITVHQLDKDQLQFDWCTYCSSASIGRRATARSPGNAMDRCKSHDNSDGHFICEISPLSSTNQQKYVDRSALYFVSVCWVGLSSEGPLNFRVFSCHIYLCMRFSDRWLKDISRCLLWARWCLVGAAIVGGFRRLSGVYCRNHHCGVLWYFYLHLYLYCIALVFVFVFVWAAIAGGF